MIDSQVSWLPGYTAHADGRVTGPTGVFRKMQKVKGYLTFSAWVDGLHTTIRLHQFICEAFHGPKPEWAEVVRHLDGDSLNNAAANVRWGTHLENAADRDAHGTTARGESHYLSQRTYCVNGHEFTPDNTYTDPRKKRTCKTCRRLRDKQRPRR